MRLNVQERVSEILLLEIIELNDNRCPVGAICNQAGFVKVSFRAFSDKETSTNDLFFSDFQQGVPTIDTILGHTIELVRVTPFPFIDKPLESPENYTVSLIVKKL